jgi:Flp pilus assembly protein TadG
MREKRRLISGRRGQSAVEFALILPVLLLIVFGILDLGRAVYSQMVMSDAVREGCRVAVVQSNSNATVIQTVLNYATGVALQASHITISGSREPGTTVTVSASYTYVPVTPLISQIVGSSIVLQASSSMVVD